MGTSTKELEWRDLAAKAQKGDQEAYTALLKELSIYLRNIMIPRLSNPTEAEDVVQEVLISVHKSLKTYASDRPFLPWLHAIASFRRTDYLRKHYARRRDKQTSFEDGNFEAEFVTNPDHIGELKDIEDALLQVPEKQRRIFTMIKVEGLTAQEVANELDMNVSAVKVSAHRTMKKLQESLK